MAEKLDEVGGDIVRQLKSKFEKNSEEADNRKIKRAVLNGWMRLA
jgi:hypothetical protein